MKTVLLLDGNNLCHRAYHSTGKSEGGEVEHGIAYGVLREVLKVQNRFGTDHVEFCFDYGPQLRRKDFPYYKSARQKKLADPDKLAEKQSIEEQIRELRDEILPEMGFAVHKETGLEGDDLLALLCYNDVYPDKSLRAAIVTGDKDLYQLIDDNVLVYSPRTEEVLNLKGFQSLYEIDPIMWVRVKAIAGCTSDSVPGVKGVGELTAIQFLNEELTTKKVIAIREFIQQTQYSDNLKLVQLPYMEAPHVRLKWYDPPSEKSWVDMADKLNMRSLFDFAGNRSIKPKRQGLELEGLLPLEDLQ